MIEGCFCNWMPITSGVLYGSVLGVEKACNSRQPLQTMIGGGTSSPSAQYLEYTAKECDLNWVTGSIYEVFR